MPPIELGPIRPVSAGDLRTARNMAKPEVPAVSTSASASQPAVVTSAALDSGSPPVDVERVTQIRHAVEKGQYPLIPARVADAMIAAGMLLRSAK